MSDPKQVRPFEPRPLKSDPKKLWETLKNFEYSKTFIHSELFIVHVNALNRANPISTVFDFQNCSNANGMCQCPQSGKSHFYRDAYLQIHCNTRHVSMPSIGQIPFLPCPSGTGLFSRFADLFLRVFFRIF